MFIIKKRNLVILLVIVVIVTILAIIDIPDKIQKLIYKKEYSEYVSKYAQEYNVDEELIYAVIKAESNFDVNAKSSKGALGLMQLMEATAIDIVEKYKINISTENIKEELLDAETNINLGTKYLSVLMQKYNNIELSITAYNAGTGTVDNWIEQGIIELDGSNIENIPYKETNNYVRRILRDYKIYQSLH